ncbi:phenylacetate--CoA ligase family protein [Parahaliea sp. F7430]|uniref:Phenylacetate--CoA ligase family protein n=2 Tax=Sediminihaliea albiluteola TaxID=2758564 RepID=A0A7W2TUQ1_9GAMM|nr:phenylacetate--CoA ligase family protein [Sediminihaliea albiluteola]
MLPGWVQSLIISIYNTYQYKVRHGGQYKQLRAVYKSFDKLDKPEWSKLQQDKLEKFLLFATSNSAWYAGCKNKLLSEFPILEKEDLINYLDKIQTITDSKGLVSYTGGTTGASMKVVYTKKDIQERYAILDNFRSLHGYELGKRTAWFSGKDLVTQKDVDSGICFRDDWINKIRFFSTFHINEKNFVTYWNALCDFKPEFIVGFPSSVFLICKMAKERGATYPGLVKVFFPTAETVLAEHRAVIEEVLGCNLRDQYASSEGAPFILECKESNKHIHPLTGIFEVVDDDFNPCIRGQLLVTSFTTHGTPLIRYKIGDSVALSSRQHCSCGSTFPIVDSIDGRSNDFLVSPEYGQVNLGNISNSTKGVDGIICFQIVQRTLDEIEIFVVPGPKFNSFQKEKFISALRARMGAEVRFVFNLVKSIPTEKSGKFRIVKNLID